jgi:hypothetical protein
MKIALAEALLRRKELQEKKVQLEKIKQSDLFEVKAQRRSVTDSIDDIVAQVPKVTLAQVTHEYDWVAKRLRLVDGIIQRTNWETQVEVEPTVMAEYLDEYEQK